jgi:hypothetical protein
MNLNETEDKEELREAIEHRDALMDIRAILSTASGKRFFKYLIKNLEVGELPPLGIEGTLLSDKLGFLRAGNAVFKLTCEADFTVAATLLAEVEKEKYERLHGQR